MSRLKSLDLASGESGGLEANAKAAKAEMTKEEKDAKIAANVKRWQKDAEIAAEKEQKINANKAIKKQVVDGEISSEARAWGQTIGEWWEGPQKKQAKFGEPAVKTAEAKPNTQAANQAAQKQMVEGTLTLVGLDKVLFKGNLGGDVGATPAAKV